MNPLENLLAAKTLELQNRLRSIWAGREREGVIDIVRAADEAAYFSRQSSSRSDVHTLIVRGATTALAALMPAMRADGSGLPFSRSSPEKAAIIDHMLLDLGKLAAMRRLAALERYGLAECRLVTANLVEIYVRSDEAEGADRAAGTWLSTEITRRLREKSRPSMDVKRIRKLLDRTSSVDSNWPIRYDGHKKLIRHYREIAAIEISGHFESEALPDDARIGGRLFSEWKEACSASYGSLLNHIDYCVRLNEKHPGIMLRDMLTTPVRARDAIEVWLERGQPTDQITPLIRQLTLDANNIAMWLKHYETPSPYYVDVGGGWLLLCTFGTLTNPIHGLVRSLRSTHRGDWDAAVDKREQRYRDDLIEAFPPHRFTIPKRNFVLRRADGSRLTDIDAVIFDRQTGNLGLIQLKWPDIFGLSPSERESKRINLLQANEWVERVTGWIADRSAREIAAALDIEFTSQTENLHLFVMPRYAARYTSDASYDFRAAWVCWPEVVRFMSLRTNSSDPLGGLTEQFKAGGALCEKEPISDVEYEISNLHVRVRSSQVHFSGQ